MARIAVVTGRRAEQEVRGVVEQLRLQGMRVDVVVLPIDVVALASLEMLARHLKPIEDKYDVIIVPGTLPYEPEELRRISPKLVKGPMSPSHLALLAEIGDSGVREALETGVLRLEVNPVEALKELRKIHEDAEGVEVCGVKIPLRPPPFAVIAEVFARNRGAGEELVRRSLELYNRGADIVVLGFGPDWDRDEVLGVLKLSDREGLIVGIDSPHWRIVAEAVNKGLSCLAFSAWKGSKLLDTLQRGSPVVVIPGEPGAIPGDPVERARLLSEGVREAESRGLTVLADPLVDPPLMGLGRSIVAYYHASSLLPRTPLMAGIANVYELADVDTHGVIAALVFVFGELGVSIFLVGEESRKAYMAVTETAIASSMASIALLRKTIPKDIGLDLLAVKEKKERPGVKLPRKPSLTVEASHLASWHGFRQDLLGSHLIAVNREEGRLRDVYIGRRGTIEVRARNAVEAYKAAAFLGLASEPSHYAFLGYELCKAELALRLKRSYVMEEDLLIPPWERPYYVSRTRSVRRSDSSVRDGKC